MAITDAAGNAAARVAMSGYSERLEKWPFFAQTATQLPWVPSAPTTSWSESRRVAITGNQRWRLGSVSTFLMTVSGLHPTGPAPPADSTRSRISKKSPATSCWFCTTRIVLRCSMMNKRCDSSPARVIPSGWWMSVRTRSKVTSWAAKGTKTLLVAMAIKAIAQKVERAYQDFNKNTR